MQPPYTQSLRVFSLPAFWWRVPMSAVALLLLSRAFAFAQVEVPPPPAPPGPPVADTAATPEADEPGLETLTRGPIHEAFANPAELDPKSEPVVKQKPPPDVPEEPPAYQPEGNFIWLPGYWAWDEDRDNFLWVTGVWRQPPPGMRWVPGYWNEIDGGWQRVKGFWVKEDVEQISYYNQPPASLDNGPSGPAPADNYFWIPGNWSQGNAGFAWQAGYWAPYQPNWVWCPARWVWTPAGFTYLPGYWDYRMTDRGQIFAPVVFTSALYTQPGWVYRPWAVIPTNNLFIHLWVRPNIGCYYFGNYYGAQYAGLGFVPWANIGIYSRQQYFYDPFYSYCHVHYRRQGIDFIGRTQGWHDYYQKHPEHRLPPTWKQQQQFLASNRGPKEVAQTQLAAQKITDVARQTDAPIRLTKIDDRSRQSQMEHVKQLRDLDSTRRKIEREQAQVSAKLPKPGEAGRDIERPNVERATPGSLVDRAEGKGEKSNKVGETTKPAVETAKLKLPKSELPAGRHVSIPSTGSDNRAKVDRRDGAPPPPSVGGRPVLTQDRTPTTSRDLGRVESGQPSERSTFGQSPSAKAKLPGSVADSGSLPGKSGDATGRGNVSGRNIEIPGRKNDVPSVNPPGRTNQLPRVQSSGPAGDVPRVDNTNRPGAVPRSDQQNTLPNRRGGTVPGNASPGNSLPGNAFPGNTLPGNTFPGNTLPGNTLPGNRGELPRGNQRNEVAPTRNLQQGFRGQPSPTGPGVQSGNPNESPGGPTGPTNKGKGRSGRDNQNG
jgi:hypothetical protein